MQQMYIDRQCDVAVKYHKDTDQMVVTVSANGEAVNHWLAAVLEPDRDMLRIVITEAVMVLWRRQTRQEAWWKTDC